MCAHINTLQRSLQYRKLLRNYSFCWAALYILDADWLLIFVTEDTLTALCYQWLYFISCLLATICNSGLSRLATLRLDRAACNAADVVTHAKDKEHDQGNGSNRIRRHARPPVGDAKLRGKLR